MSTEVKKLGGYDFGLVIAFLLPGFIFLWALALSFPAAATWLVSPSATASQAGPELPSVAGFLYSTLASLALGLILSALRWCVIDWLLSRMNVKDPGLEFSKLKDPDTAWAFRDIVENHYRYYQYYANTLVALVAGAVAYALSGHSARWQIYVMLSFVIVVLFFGARDALKKYYRRAEQILGLETAR